MGYVEQAWAYVPKDREQLADSIKATGIDWRVILYIYLAFWTVRRVYRAVYDIWFHPLAKYPGPFLCRFTSLYEFYWDLVQDGQMAIHITEDLHPKYGDIVRVGPNRIAMRSLKAWNDIHYVGSPFLKDPHLYGTFGLDNATFGQYDPKKHRERRQYLSVMFSKKGIMKLEPLVREKIGLLMERFERDIRMNGTGTETGVINVYNPYGALTSDISMVFSFGDTYDLLKRDDYNDPFMTALDDTMYAYWWMKHFRFLITMSKAIPPHILGKVSPGVAGINRMGEMAQGRIKEIFQEVQDAKHNPSSKESEDPNAIPIVFREMLKTLPPKWANPQFLFFESVSVFGAGLHTSRWVMVTFAYHVAKNQDVQRRLLEELKTVWPDVRGEPPSYTVLESLPYLSGCVKESLRMGHGVVGSLARAVPAGGATVAGEHFPEGIAIDMSPYVLHHNRDIFPDSHTFNPGRWSDVDLQTRLNMDRYIGAFGGGSRICLGVNLAYMELYYLIAAQVRRFELRLTEKFEREGLRWKERWMVAPVNDPLDVVMTVRHE